MRGLFGFFKWLGYIKDVLLIGIALCCGTYFARNLDGLLARVKDPVYQRNKPKESYKHSRAFHNRQNLEDRVNTSTNLNEDQNLDKDNIIEKLTEHYLEMINSSSSVRCDDDNFEGDSDLMLLARMVFGEARNQPVEAMIGVAYTAVNRLRIGGWYGTTLKEVLLKPWQYSCFNRGDPNREKLKDPLKYERRETLARCLAVAHAVLNGLVKDPTNGATHYFSGNRKPRWARKMEGCGKIGDFRFYKESRTICK